VQDGQAPIAAACTPSGEQEAGEPGDWEPPEPAQEPRQEELPAHTQEQPDSKVGPTLPGTVLPGARGKPRPARYRLSIRFESAPDDPELGRLIESTVVVNDAHPAYRRAEASRSEGYHLALTVALALAPLAVETIREHAFVTAFLTCWGEAIDRQGGQHRRTR